MNGKLLITGAAGFLGRITLGAFFINGVLLRTVFRLFRRS